MKKEKDAYQLPSGYFEDFQSRLQVQIELEALLGEAPKSGFTVPEDYFNTLSRKLNEIPSQPQTTSKVIKLKSRMWQATGIAAAIAILFGLFIGNYNATSGGLNTDELTAYLDIESAYLDTEDILALLSEEELNTMTLNEESHPEDEILYYLETYSNTYDLILE